MILQSWIFKQILTLRGILSFTMGYENKLRPLIL